MATMALPDHILMEILLRLPVKSLLCLRSVSKFWNYFIQNHNFVKLHQNRSLITNKNCSLFVLRTIHLSPGPNIHNAVLISLVAETLTLITDINYTELLAYPTDKYRSIRLHGPCNGIICILDREIGEDCYVLCNPATKEFKTLPHPPFSYPENMHICDILTGFGFDAIANDYKIVRVVKPCHRYQYNGNTCVDHLPWKVEMYTLLNDIYTEIDIEIPFSLTFYHLSHITFDDSCYWIGHERYDEGDRCMFIVVFDIVEEVFRKIQLPDEEEFFDGLNYGYRLMLIVIEGSLAVIKYNFSTTDCLFHLWIMREYGVVEPCIKIQIKRGSYPWSYRPLTGRNVDELFMERGDGRLVLWNPRTGEIIGLGLSGLRYTFEVVLLRECLTSIKGFAPANDYIDQNWDNL